MPAALTGLAPVYLVDDVVATANWYRDRLGFHYDRFWGEPPCFVMVKRDGLIVMFKSLEDKRSVVRSNHTVHPDAPWDGYFWTTDADALYAEFQSRGVKVVHEICNQEYGCRDFSIEDCNGYVFCFGTVVDRAKPKAE